MPRTPWLLLALAVASRAFGAAITPVPGRDGVAYLWIAEQFADGDPTALCQTVFHPLYPALVGLLLLVAPGDVVVAGQLVAGLTGALAVVPLWWLTRARFGERAAFWAGAIYAIGAWFVRHPADCMSEGPFYLLATLWAASLLGERRHVALAGALAGLAFLTRPEGIALAGAGAIWLLANGQRRAATVHLAIAATFAALMPLAMLCTGQGFALTPKAAFNWDVGAGAADSALGYYLMQWLRWPGDAWEGLGYVVLPLIVAGAIRLRPRRLADWQLGLLLPFLTQLAVVPLLKSHHRFVSGFGVLLLPFAGATFADLLAAVRARGRWWPPLLIALLLGSEAKLFVDRPTDRTIERDLGRWLESQRSAAETIASDMPRLLFFAGLPPPPPRRLTADDLLATARAPNCRFVALKRGRTALPAETLAALGFSRRELPATLILHPQVAEIELYGR